jgi:hypothetical protein
MGATPGIGLGGGGGPATGTGTGTGGGGGSSSSSGGGGGGSPSSGGGGGGGSSSISPLLGPVLPAPPAAPPGSPGAGGGGSGGGLAPPSLSGALGGLGGASTTTTDPATGITTTIVAVPPTAPTAQELADAAATATTAAKGGAGDSVMVAGPKVPIGVGNYPEYDEAKAKTGNKVLTNKDYRDILNKVAEDYPQLFPEAGTKKVSTYINALIKTELIAYSEKVLQQKYAIIDQQRKSSATLIQNAVRGRDARAELRQLKYQALANASASRQYQKEFSSASRVQTQFRSHLAKQEYARQILFGSSPSAAGTPLSSISNVYDPSAPFNQAEFDAFFGP